MTGFDLPDDAPGRGVRNAGQHDITMPDGSALAPGAEWPGGSLVDAADALVPLADSIAAVIARVATGRVEMSSRDDRTSLVTLRAALIDVIEPARSAVAFIEQLFMGAFSASGADMLSLDDGAFVRWERPRPAWQADGPALRSALLALMAAGDLTSDEVDGAVPAVLSYQPNHTRLNALAAHRGDAVRDAIEAHRQKVPAPGQGRINWPKG